MDASFETELSQKIEEVNKIMERFAPLQTGLQKNVMEAMNYSFLANGKRLRPLIMQETYKMFGGNSEEIEPFMAAIEMIHTYSLIHDDLPCMDNDDYRRGRKTNHIVYGEPLALLAGDSLLNFAFETASENALNNNNPQKCLKAINILGKKAGIYGMIGGQTIDIETEGTPIGLDTIKEIHKLKTAALIEASMMIGAVMAEATDEQVKEVEKIAYNVGLAFQIQDDVLDVTSTTEELGKPVLSDEKNDKTTYVSIVGIQQSKEDVKRYTQTAMDGLTKLNKDSKFLSDLFEKLINRKK